MHFLAIAGNIGAGKSSLTALIAKHYNWNAVYESVDDNPYLADFYEDMKRWSFNLQIYFLSSRFRHQKQLMLSTESFVQDRTIYEDVEIFAKNLFEMNLMAERDYTNYKALFNEMVSYLRPPGLLIYLRAKVPTLVRQIQKRGRDYENTIRIDYLERLNKHYEDWIERYPHPKLIIETDDLDFVNQPEDLGVILDLI
ncbi:MAG: deoxynucleoside kinase, partial [Bacteroidetes bacterium]|nr:deoxynucleoside kinase [Bacteroidota bacterium]